jgi:aspartate 4-decarboxylase
MADMLTLRKFEALSPFEIKDELINLAKATSKRSQSAFLNAGRGNPNWVATTPREGFFLLGQFAITESKRVMEHPAGIGGMPQAKGIAARMEAWLAAHSDMPGAGFLKEMVPFAVKRNSASSRTPLSTSSSTPSSATITRCRIACWCTMRRLCTNI